MRHRGLVRSLHGPPTRVTRCPVPPRAGGGPGSTQSLSMGRDRTRECTTSVCTARDSLLQLGAKRWGTLRKRHPASRSHCGWKGPPPWAAVLSFSLCGTSDLSFLKRESRRLHLLVVRAYKQTAGREGGGFRPIMAAANSGCCPAGDFKVQLASQPWVCPSRARNAHHVSCSAWPCASPSRAQLGAVC